MTIHSTATVLEQRFFICLFAFIFSFFVCVAGRGNIYDLFTIYIIVAICFDQLSRFIKPVSMSKKALLKQHTITQNQLEKYIQSKRDYRLFTAGVASLVGSVAFILGSHFSTVFTIVCALIWFFYPLYRIYALKISAPRILKTFQLSSGDYPHNQMHNPRNSLTWDAFESNRFRSSMDSMNPINSHSKDLH